MTSRPRRRTRFVLLGAAAALAVTAGVAVTQIANAASTLKQLADARGFAMGMAIDANRINGATYRAIVDAESNSVTPGNEMKWDATENVRGTFTYTRGDAIVSYAQSAGKTVRGHTLVWHSQTPSWVAAITSATELRSVMLNHISNVAGHFQGKVTDWDVVNEPFNEDGTRRASVFQNVLGDGYIAEALRAARAADPAAKLYLNDYNTDGVGAKSNAMYALAQSLLAQGVPLDGIGIQGHLIIGQVPSTMQQNIARFAALGLDVKITELDIRMNTPADATKLAQQAADYRTVFNACLAVARCTGITVWGVGEQDSWIPSTFPGQGEGLLYDINYARKPAYDAVNVALGGSTTTPTTTPGGATTSPVPPTTTPPAAGTGCTATYRVASQWNGGFTGEVAVRNDGSTALNGWTVRWTYANGQVISQVWSGVLSASGSSVTVRNAGYNGAVQPAATTTFGFNASWTGTNAVPANVTCASP